MPTVMLNPMPFSAAEGEHRDLALDGSGALRVSQAGTVSPQPSIGTAVGTITGLNQSVEIDCSGYASVLISIVGMFTGTLRARGSADTAAAGAAMGGRLLFKSGVGSVGVPTVTNTGVAISNEYRAVAGGKRFVIDASAWTSGQAVVTIVATPAPSVLFVNGPVHTAVEEAQRAGRAFSISSMVQTVNAAQFLNIVLVNPANSGKRLFVDKRLFFTNIAGGNTPAEVWQMVQPTNQATVAPTVIAPINLVTGGGASVAQAFYGVNAARLIGSPDPSGAFAIVPTGGIPYDIETDRIVEPGQAFGHSLGGAGGGLAASARLSMSMVFFQEDVT